MVKIEEIEHKERDQKRRKRVTTKYLKKTARAD